MGKSILEIKGIESKILDVDVTPEDERREKSYSEKLKAFIDIYIKGHPSGYSSFPDICYCHTPEFVMRDGLPDGKITNLDVDPLWIEWVYVIDPQECKMIIFVSVEAKDSKSEDPKYELYKVCEIELNPDKPEPNWKEIEEKGYKIREERSKEVI